MGRKTISSCVTGDPPWSHGGPNDPNSNGVDIAAGKKHGSGLFAAVAAIRSGKAPKAIFNPTFQDGHPLDAEILEHFAKTGELMEVSRQLRRGQHVNYTRNPEWEPTFEAIMVCVDQAFAHLWKPLSKADGAHQWDVKRDQLREEASAGSVGYEARRSELLDLAHDLDLPLDYVAHREAQLLALRKVEARKLAGHAAKLIFEIIKVATPSALPHAKRHRAGHSKDAEKINRILELERQGWTRRRAVGEVAQSSDGTSRALDAERKRLKRKIGQIAGNS